MTAETAMFQALLQAAREGQLSAEEIELVKKKKGWRMDIELRYRSTIELSTVEEPVGAGLAPGTALRLNAPFPGQ